jgi:hypothetical protein
LKTKLQILLPFSVLLVIAFASSVVLFSQKKRVTVSFDYDFRLTPACPPTLTRKCVEQFNVYDISGGTRMQLFSIPVPPGAIGFVKGIRGTSQPLRLAAGEHILGLTAQSPDGAQSEPSLCTTTVIVKPYVTLPAIWREMWRVRRVLKFASASFETTVRRNPNLGRRLRRTLAPGN